MTLYFNETEYPNLDSAIRGQLKNKVYGELKNVPAGGIVTGATSLLAATITAAATSVTVLDASRFPATPFTIQINAERMRVTSKAAAVFTVTRGYDNTEPLGHDAEQTVFEALTEYVYLLNDAALDEINNVYIDRIVQAPANYTAYTGQAGDAHADWPGVAVIVFTATEHIGQQFNFTLSADVIGDIKPGKIEFSSSPELSTIDPEALTPDISGGLWGVTIGSNGAGTTQEAFVKFAADYGTIISQTYFIDVENASLELKTINATVLITEGDDVKLSTEFSIPKNQTFTFEVTRTGGVFNDVLRIFSYDSDLIVTDMRKNVLINKESFQSASNPILTQEIPALQQILTSSPTRFAIYPTTPLGTSIVKQTHIVELIDASGDDDFMITILAVEKNGTVLASKDMTLSGSSTLYGSLTHDAGSYDTATVVSVNNQPTNSVQKVKIKKIIQYTTDTATAESSLAATSSGRVVVGNLISADAKFTVDTSGDFGGVGNLIQNPADVIKHYLVTEKGAALAEIDTTSFAAARSLYAGAGYELNFIRSLSIDEDQMAYECRSVVYMTRGKYYLDVILDTAPAVDMIVYEGDVIDAVGFTYDHGKIEDLHTDYTARHGLGGDGIWGGVVTAVDAGNKYGTHIKSIDLPLVKAAAMAQSVLDNILLQHQELYATVKFTVTWKYQALNIGDTFQVSCSLYNGAKFFVEKLKINDDNTISIEGKNWW